MSVTSSFFILLPLLAACLYAAWSDLIYRRIANWLSLFTAVAGLFASFVIDASIGELASHALHMVLALICTMGLYAFGFFGGGDAKFYAAVAAWFPLSQAIELLVAVALSGIFVLLGWFIYRRFRGYKISRQANEKSSSLPYGIAIGSGALFIAFV